MRRYQQGLLMIITVIIIISFAWLYTDYKYSGRRGEDSVGYIYDRPVRLGEYQRGLRRMQLTQELELMPLVYALGGNARTERDFQANFVFNTYVLRHETDQLGLVPTDAEVVEEIKKMRIFQADGGAFDSTRYTLIVQNLGHLGFDESTLEEVVRDSLRFQKLNKLFSSTITGSSVSAREIFERRNQKTEVALVRLNEEEVAKTIQVSEEDLKKAFEERKESLKTDEKRKVRFVSLLLSDDEKKLSGAERAAAFQKLLDKANDVAVAMTVKDAKFDEVAKKFELEVKETPEFTQATPPAELAQSQEVAAAVFAKLTMEQPNSDALITANGYYIVQLTGVTPARPLTFEEAKDKLSETLKNERVSEALDLRANELRAKLETDLKAGKSFAEAAQAAGVPVETPPAFSGVDRPKPEVKGGEEVAEASMGFAVGQLSEVLRFEGGRLIFRVEKRQPIDEAAFEKDKSKLVEQLGDFQARSAFPLWLAERRKAANLQSKIEG
jgi:peptidyl-prolyl cis-trans isomerase D